MKISIIAVSLLLAQAAHAQTTQYYGNDGSYQGYTYTNGANTQVFGRDGSYQGYTYSNNGTTQYFGRDGSYQGYAQ